MSLQQDFKNMDISSASYGADADDDNYKPGIASTSSVILLVVGSVALVLSTFVAVSIHRYGTKSASSRLVFMINCAQGMGILAKLPFVFNNIPYGCTISQIILIYAFTQLWLVSYMMLLCTNHLKLDMKSTIYSSTDLGLNRKHELFLYICPLVSIILPIAANAFEEKYNWCITDPRVHNGYWILGQVALFMCVIVGFILRQAWVIFRRAQELSQVLPPRKLLERILKGPFVYAFITILFGFVGVFMVRGSDAMADQTSRKAYFVKYAIVYLFFIPGYLNFFIFFVERRHLKVS